MATTTVDLELMFKMIIVVDDKAKNLDTNAIHRSDDSRRTIRQHSESGVAERKTVLMIYT